MMVLYETVKLLVILDLTFKEHVVTRFQDQTDSVHEHLSLGLLFMELCVEG